MIIIWSFIQTFWKPIALVLVVGGLVFFVYEKGVTSGEKACEEKHLLLDQKRDAAINDRIDKLASGSIEIANTNKESANKIKAQINELAKSFKGPLVIYKDGKCEPTKTYIDTINAINRTANEKK